MVSQKYIEKNGSIKDHGHLQPKNISRDEYFMDIARVVAEKCTCDRGKCGCVIVKDNSVISS
jgi:deoxycytidylate deaminase